MQIKEFSRIKWRWLDIALSVPRPLAAIAVLFGLGSIFGYLLNIEWLYRPVPNGPATNPLTATIIILIGMAIYHQQKHKLNRTVLSLLASAALLMTIVRIYDALSGSHFSSVIMPFHDVVVLENEMGKNNTIGINTAVMLFFISLAVLFKGFGNNIASQSTAAIAVAIPMISFVGYGYGLQKFYGEMSMLTAKAGFMLSLAGLTLTADKLMLRSILSPYVGGKIARYQVLAGFIVPIVFGYFFHVFEGNDDSLFGLFVVAICWFVVIMVGISAMHIERADRSRRQSGRMLADAAFNDHLTGLPNRKLFFDVGENEFSLSAQNRTPLCVLMLDIDNFKNINDVGGHAMGDRVLVELAKTLKSSVRKTDIVARIGGEEFTVLLADSSRASAKRVAETIRTNIENMPIKGWTDVHGPVTTSIGCNYCNGSSSTLDEALNEADKALYISKNNGKNQVTFTSRFPEGDEVVSKIE